MVLRSPYSAGDAMAGLVDQTYKDLCVTVDDTSTEDGKQF
jgi:hypothetical protein